MKKIILLTLLMAAGHMLSAQEQSRAITTAVPFLNIASDARTGGMGELGAASSADVFSQFWNPAKYAFTESEYGVGLSYTPYLNELVNDMALLNLAFYNRINERSAWAAGVRYFSLGDIEYRNSADEIGITERPNQLTIDATYALKLSEEFSMAVTGRYLRSDLKLYSGPGSGLEEGAAGSAAVDVSGFYESKVLNYGKFDGRWRAGANLSNIGPKIKYDTEGQDAFIPTNVRIGGGFDFILDNQNSITALTEFSKLMVPTPSDSNNDGVINSQDSYYSKSFFSGMFSSFGDAPGGFGEELKEVTWAMGAEYWYQDVFALRTGYFNESNDKGGRKFMTLGTSLRFRTATIDLSYLMATSKINNPLENTLRFSLRFDLGNATPNTEAEEEVAMLQ